MYTKPSSLPFVHGYDGPSIWTDPWDVGAGRPRRGGRRHAHVGRDRARRAGPVAIASRENDFLYLFFGHGQRNPVKLVPVDGGRVPSDATMARRSPGDACRPLRPLVAGRRGGGLERLAPDGRRPLHDGLVAGSVIALLLGLLLVGAASSCGTALLRPTGRIAFVVGTAVLAFAEVVAVSHGLSFVDAYERRWFLAATAALAVAALIAVAVVRPPWPSFRLGRRRPRGAARPGGRRARRRRGGRARLRLRARARHPAERTPTASPTTSCAACSGSSSSPSHRSEASAITRIDEFQPDAEILQALTMLLSGSARYAALVRSRRSSSRSLAIFGLALADRLRSA